MGRRPTGNIRYLPARDRWQVRVTDPLTQKRRSVTVASKEEAEEILEAAQARIQAVPKTLGGTTLATFIPRWLEEHRADYAPKTWQSLEGRLRNHVLTDTIAEAELRDLTAPDFHRLLNRKLKGKVSWNTRRNIRVGLVAVVKSAIKEGLMLSNPLRDIDVEGKREVGYYKFSLRDLTLLLESPEIPRHRQLRYRITFYLGQRSDDIWGITLRDIDLEEGVAKIWCKKQQTQITYPLLPPAIEAIMAWTKHLRRYRNNPDGLLFPSKQTGKRRKADSNNPNEQLRKDCRALGIRPAPGTRICWHSWRGSLATALQAGWLSSERWSAEDVARLLGHADASTTRRHYSHQEYINPVERLAEQAKGVRSGLRLIPGGAGIKGTIGIKRSG